MTKILLPLLIVAFAMACDSGVNIPLGGPSSACPKKTELSFPVGLEINTLSTIAFDGDIETFSYVSGDVFYALGNHGDDIALFKSNDGGGTWSDLDLSYPGPSGDIFFANDTLGIVTLDGPRGNLIRTRDGKNWTQKEYANLNGRIMNIHKDDQDHLFAILEGSDGLGMIITSEDHADSWEVLNAAIPMFDTNFFTFTVYEDKIYILSEGNSIVVADTKGVTERMLKPEVGFVWDVEVIDSKNLIISGVDKTVKTTDGGLHWTELYDDNARIIHFQNVDHGLMLFNKGLCQSDAFISNDTFATTEDGGLTWIEGDIVTNLTTRYKDAVSLASGEYILLIGNSFYTLNQ